MTARDLPSFTDASENPIAVMVGLLLTPVDPNADGPCVVVLGWDAQYTPPTSTRPFLEHVTQPRRVPELTAWMASQGAASDTLDRLVAAGKMLKVTPSVDPVVTLRQFAGYRLIPVVDRLDWPEDEAVVEGVEFIGRSEQYELAMPMSRSLVQAIWEGNPEEDFPSTLLRLADESGLGTTEYVGEALEWLSALLASQYAFVSPVTTQ